MSDASPSSGLNRRMSMAAMVGSIVEWYDFTLYGAASALVFAKVFFDAHDLQSSAVSSFLTFAAGFLARPFGGALFGHFGDRLGRRPMLIVTLVLMGLSTTAIGCLPTRDSIGALAPLLLVLLRVLQGLGAGAEYAGALLIARESSSGRRRGFAVSLPAAGTYVGSLIALLVFALFAQLPSDSFLAWGWRVPFLFSIAIAGFGYWLRYSLEETREFVRVKGSGAAARSPIVEVVSKEWRRVLTAMGANASLTGVSYVLQVFAIRYMNTSLHLSPSSALLISCIGYLTGIVLLPFWGMLVDRLGTRTVFLGGQIFSLLFVFPLFWLLDFRNFWIGALALSAALGIGIGAQFAAQGAFLTALFPVRVRYTGVALSREVTSAVLSGPAPAVATLLVAAAGGAWWLLATVMCAFTLIGIFSVAYASRFMPEASSDLDPAIASVKPAIHPPAGF